MMLQLETERLLLRPYQLSDAAHLFEMNTDAVVLKYTGDTPFETMGDARDYITDYVENPHGQIIKYNMGRLACIEKSSDEFVGFCGIKTQPASQIVDIGYRFRRSQWGKGFATEACQEVLKFAFEVHELNQIIAHVHEQNIGSQRVAEKLGFKMEHRFLWDGELPGRYYKLTRDVYCN